MVGVPAPPGDVTAKESVSHIPAVVCGRIGAIEGFPFWILKAVATELEGSEMTKVVKSSLSWTTSESILQILAWQAPACTSLLIKVVRFSLDDPPQLISTKIEKKMLFVLSFYLFLQVPKIWIL